MLPTFEARVTAKRPSPYKPCDFLVAEIEIAFREPLDGVLVRRKGNQQKYSSM